MKSDNPVAFFVPGYFILPARACHSKRAPSAVDRSIRYLYQSHHHHHHHEYAARSSTTSHVGGSRVVARALTAVAVAHQAFFSSFFFERRRQDISNGKQRYDTASQHILLVSLAACLLLPRAAAAAALWENNFIAIKPQRNNCAESIHPSQHEYNESYADDDEIQHFSTIGEIDVYADMYSSIITRSRSSSSRYMYDDTLWL